MTSRTALTLLLANALLAAAISAQDALQTKTGDAYGDAYGIAMRPAGDVDKDGIGDFVVGAPGNDANGANSGSVSVYSGADSRIIHLFRGADPQNEFGYSVDGAGDVNRDGYEDVVIGAPHQDTTGEDPIPAVGSAQVFSGRDGKLLYTFMGEHEGEALGWSVCGVGDANHDGYADVAAGAPFFDRKELLDIGRVVVYSGKTGDEIYHLAGHTPGDRFGWSMCRVKDLDRDQSPEILVGIEGSQWRKKQGGSAQLFSGRAGRSIRTLRTGDEDDYFGVAVADAGDVDGDGAADLLIGAWNGVNHDDRRTGVALVYSGKTGKLLLRVAGTSEHDRFGAAVSGIGDVDRDGHADIVVGAPQEAGRGSGYVRAFSGATGKILYTLIGEAIGDSFGTSVCRSPDRDSDGLADILVGAPGMNDAGGWKIFRSAVN